MKYRVIEESSSGVERILNKWSKKNKIKVLGMTMGKNDLRVLVLLNKL